MLNFTRNIFLILLFIGSAGKYASAQTGPLEIWQIQGAAAASPYEGQSVITTVNVITAVGNGFFVVQTPTDRSDDNAATSDGLYVASTQAGNRKVGELVQVQGTVFEIDRRTQLGQGSVQVTVEGTTETMPEPVVLNENFPSGQPQPVPELEAVEGMLIQFEGIASGPSDYRSMVPVVARSERPFREPGIHYPGLPNLPVWDGNPEIFWMAPNGLGQPPNRFIVARTPISASGPMLQFGTEYVLFPSQYLLGSTPDPRPVPAAESPEITIGCLNTRRLQSSDDLYDQKLRKMAKYIVQMLKGPDLLALQEIGSKATLSSLVFFIHQLDPELNYSPLFLAGNDDIHLAYLVQEEKFSEIAIRQLAKEKTMPGGSTLFDRPPLLFTAEIRGTPATPLSVLNLHLRSLLGIEGNNETFVREKRYRQSLAISELVDEYRENNLIVLGDFNAFPFSDGYVDPVNQIIGTPGQDAQYPVASVAYPPLQNLSDSLAPEERYSYVFDGSAQLIDHALAGELEGLRFTRMAFARANADFPDAFAPNDQLVQRSSDHDGFVVYLAAELSTAVSDRLHPEVIRIFPNPVSATGTVQLSLPAESKGKVELVTLGGQILQEITKREGEVTANFRIDQPGWYVLRFRDGRTIYRAKIAVLSAK